MHPNDLLPALFVALSELRATTPRARQRTVTSDDLRCLCERIASAEPQPDDVRLTARLHGGFVSGAYKGNADADSVCVEIDLRENVVTRATVSRRPAQRRPHGNGAHIVVRLSREGQTDGRVV
jgi:hypothetical protein